MDGLNLIVLRLNRWERSEDAITTGGIEVDNQQAMRLVGRVERGNRGSEVMMLLLLLPLIWLLLLISPGWSRSGVGVAWAAAEATG